MKKRWVLKKQADTVEVERLSKELKVNKIIAALLIQRGIHNSEQAESFFNPDLKALHDPFLMKDMNIAIERIERAINNNEKILVFGDYDVDGTTAVAVVLSFFKKFYSEIDYYIPDRYDEGYGISIKGIDFAAENNFKLIISVDCGIKAVDKVAYAKSKNIDFIICDHHRPGDELPAAVAILDPKQNGCNYPFKELSGCGVGFKLIHAYAKKYKMDFESIEQYLDLVAISIASDIVEITGENRILTYFGLKRINLSPRPGIEAILTYTGVTRKPKAVNEYHDTVFARELNVNDLVFMIGPRLNASGRIEHGKSTVELLICNDPGCAKTIGEAINVNNIERRTFDSSITLNALSIIENDSELMNASSTVLFNPDWHKGVVGIVASRLIEKYYRPTIVLTESNGLVSGSARSVKDFDIYNAIDSCSDLLEHFGGHKYAAGLSLKIENLDVFKKRFEEVVKSTLTEKMLTPEIEIDMQLNFSDINDPFFHELLQFAPFGPGNLSPIFVTRGVVDNGSAKHVGSNHLKLFLSQPQSSTKYFQGIAFQQGEHLSAIAQKVPFDLCYHIEENQWNGKIYLQLNIKDINLD